MSTSPPPPTERDAHALARLAIENGIRALDQGKRALQLLRSELEHGRGR